MAERTHGQFKHCGVSTCLNDTNGRRYCGGHRKRKQQHGDVLAHLPLKVYAPNGTGTIDPEGYWRDYAHGHPLVMVGGMVLRHRRILYDALGPGSHPCHWCDRLVAWEDPYPLGLTVDHRDGVRKNNERSNLVPACRPCNAARAKLGNPDPWTPILAERDAQRRNAGVPSLTAGSGDVSAGQVPFSGPSLDKA